MARRRARTSERRGAPRKKNTEREADSFRIVVAANSGSELDLTGELELVKAALLYGDSVVLLSPVTTMLLHTEVLKTLSATQQITLVRKVAPYLTSAEEAARLESGLEEVDQFLRRTSAGGSPQSRLLRAQLMQRLAPTQAMLADAVQELSQKSGAHELTRARSEGLVQIDSAHRGNAVDLVAACVIAAKLAESGRKPTESFAGELVDAFVTKLSRHLSAGQGYLIFDERIAALTDAAIREGLFRPSKGPPADQRRQ